MIKIREARKEDALSIAKIHSNTWKMAYRKIIPQKVLEKITHEKNSNILIQF